MIHTQLKRVRTGRQWSVVIACTLLVVLAFVLAACGTADQPEAAAPAPAAQEAAATTAPTEEPTAAPAEEAAATTAPEEEATTAPAEEPAATAEPAEEVAMSDEVAAGQYVVNITGGCGCHMNRDLGALAGGNTFEGDFGVVYASNITPDPDTGIGNWTAEQIADVLHTGATPDGDQLVAAMPYREFSAMSNGEALAVAAYLLSLEPVVNEVPPREVTTEAEPFTPATAPPAEAPTDPVARGEVLVTIARCGGCHTPKNEDGSVMADMLLAGAPLREEYAHNITPDEETGIGTWSEAEIANFMRTGTFPDGSQVEGAMAQQIDRRFSQLTETDAAAIAAYLKSIPAVSNAAPTE